MSSPGKFVTSLIDWNLLIIALMVKFGIFNALALFFGFTPCDGRLREFGFCVPHIYNPVRQEIMAGQFHAPSHDVLKNVNMNGNILQRYFTHKNF